MSPPWSPELPVGPWETTTSIGGRCRARERYSRAVLRAREAWPVSLGACSRPAQRSEDALVPASSSNAEEHPTSRSRFLYGRWLWRGGSTRSHPELGSENPLRGWYCRGHPVGEYGAAGLIQATARFDRYDRGGRLLFLVVASAAGPRGAPTPGSPEARHPLPQNRLGGGGYGGVRVGPQEVQRLGRPLGQAPGVRLSRRYRRCCRQPRPR